MLRAIENILHCTWVGIENTS